MIFNLANLSIQQQLNVHRSQVLQSCVVVSNSTPVSLLFPHSASFRGIPVVRGNFERSFIVLLFRRGYSLRHIFGPLTPLVAMGWRTSARTTQAKADLTNSHTHDPCPVSIFLYIFLPSVQAGFFPNGHWQRPHFPWDHSLRPFT